MSLFPFSRPTLRQSALLASAAALIVISPNSAVRAQYIYEDGSDLAMRREAQRLTPQQQEELFRARKTWKRQSFNRRISILEKEKRCIDNARNPQSFKACIDNKREARRALRADYRSYINPVRRQVGLAPLEPKQNDRRQGKGKGKGNRDGRKA